MKGDASFNVVNKADCLSVFSQPTRAELTVMMSYWTCRCTSDFEAYYVLIGSALVDTCSGIKIVSLQIDRDGRKSGEGGQVGAPKRRWPGSVQVKILGSAQTLLSC